MTAAEGTSRRVDVRVDFNRGPLSAYVGYAYSWTRYTAAQANFGEWFGTDVRSYHPPHDRRHELNVLLAADLAGVEANLRWQFGSGRPYTQPFGFDAFIRLRGMRESPESFGRPRLLYEKPYRGRLPAHHRLDVSLECSFELGLVNVTAKGGAINAYDQQNPFYFDLFTRRRVDQMPVFPRPL